MHPKSVSLLGCIFLGGMDIQKWIHVSFCDKMMDDKRIKTGVDGSNGTAYQPLDLRIL